MVLNLRISHARKMLETVPEFMISCEYIRILRYCMYISNCRTDDYLLINYKLLNGA